MLSINKALRSYRENYYQLATGIYLNYTIIGMATILISQYSYQFQKLWHTNLNGISLVIALIGIGRLLVILLAGHLSDQLKRKNTMLIGIGTQIIFLLGLVLSPNLFWAEVTALFMGIANAFADTSSYPALNDAFKNNTHRMNLFVKAAMSMAQLLIPFIVMLSANVLVTVMGMVIITLIGFVTVATSDFASEKSTKNKQDEVNNNQFQNQPSLIIDGGLLICLGFSISFTFYIFSQYAPNFGNLVLKLSPDTAKTFISWYASASLISVFFTALIVKKIKPLYLIIVYTFFSTCALAVMILVQTVATFRLASILLGFFAAGGIWQLSLSILISYFPTRKGKVTSYYSFATALTFFIGPFIASIIINPTAQSMIMIFTLALIISTVSVVMILIITIRNKYYKFYAK